METGEEMSPEWQEILDTPVKTKALDEDKRVGFALKMLATSGDMKFRLLFKVSYQMGDSDETLEDTVISQCYRVESNRKKSSMGTFCVILGVIVIAERPKIWQLKPVDGPASDEVLQIFLQFSLN